MRMCFPRLDDAGKLRGKSSRFDGGRELGTTSRAPNATAFPFWKPSNGRSFGLRVCRHRDGSKSRTTTHAQTRRCSVRSRPSACRLAGTALPCDPCRTSNGTVGHAVKTTVLGRKPDGHFVRKSSEHSKCDRGPAADVRARDKQQ